MARIQFSIYLFCITVYAELHDLTGYVNLQIIFKKDVNKLHFTLNCSSMFLPNAAEFLINDITTAKLKSSNGVCYISRRICKKDECSCTNQNYVWTFWPTTDDRKSLEFTCKLQFVQENAKSIVTVQIYETKMYYESDIFGERKSFQQKANSTSNSTQGNNNTRPAIEYYNECSGHFQNVYILLVLPVISTVIFSLILRLYISTHRKIDAIEDGKQLSPEETSSLKRHMQTRQTELHTELDEIGTEEYTIICQRISEANIRRTTKDDVEINEYKGAKHEVLIENIVSADIRTTKDDVEINEYKGAKHEDEFYQLLIICDNFVVDCIVDNRLKRKCRESVFKFQECIEKMIQWSGTTLCFKKKVEDKFLNIVKTKNSCLCKYLLNHTSNNAIETHILVNALHSSIKNNDVDTAKFIGWQIARHFLKSLNVHVYDIWLASLCSCSRLKKKLFSWFCSNDVTIIIMVPHLNKEVVNNFFGIPIKQIVYHCETFDEAQAISEERAKLLERDLNIQCHVPGPLAEKLFNSHRRLSLVSPSEIKSIDFKDCLAMPTFLKCSCIQLFCYVKGAIPIGEKHFRSKLNGIPTDVIEGFPRFSSNNLKIGDCVTNLKMAGTLGGFCLSYGREAFLTCAHGMIDWDTLLSPGNKYHMQPEFVYNNDSISNGPLLCGKVVNHKFTHHNPRKTSTDVALIEIANGVSVSEYDYVNTRGKGPLNYAQLGLKSRFLHDSYIRSLHGLSGQSVEVVCAGAVSGFNRLVRSISEKPEHVLEREGLQSASTNLETRTCNYLDQQAQVSTPVHMRAHVPAIIHESRKEEVYSRRTLRFYNQLAVNNIPFEQGDSGACIYITNGYTETGCLGMAIADLPGGGCIVTPMAKLLEKLGLI